VHKLSQIAAVSVFSTKLTDLSALNQYKLVVSLADHYFEGELRVGFFAPLLDSPYLLVKELVLHKLEIMLENYGREIIDQLTSFFKPEDPAYKHHFVRLEKHLTDFNTQISKTLHIKELDPRYTQHNYWKQFQTLQQRDWRESVDKHVQQHSLAAVLSTQVMVAKGGGFKIRPEDEIGTMKKIGTSVSLPREYLLFPELYDWEMAEAGLENWKGKFESWEVAISS
jgi:hypothetical protein